MQNYSAEVDEKCSTEKDISEYTITEQKDAESNESSVTKEVLIYFNIFECGRKILDILDVTYEQAYMETQKYKYCEKMFEILVNNNNCNGTPLSNEKLQ